MLQYPYSEQYSELDDMCGAPPMSREERTEIRRHLYDRGITGPLPMPLAIANTRIS